MGAEMASWTKFMYNINISASAIRCSTDYDLPKHNFFNASANP